MLTYVGADVKSCSINPSVVIQQAKVIAKRLWM